jgi:exosortase family protein XrtM
MPTYRPDPRASQAARLPWRSLLVFVVAFFLLQSAFEATRGTAFERLLVHTLTLEPAALLVNLFAPAAGAVAHDASLVGSTARLNILAGCEGVEAILLLAAAMIATGRGWRAACIGITAGTVVVHLVNVLRVGGLYLAAARDRELFAVLHGYVAPVLMIGVAVLMFNAWLARSAVART